MIEVYPSLFVGNQLDYENTVKGEDGPRDGWAVVHSCKEPYHREALGYTGRGAPRDHDEYLFAFRGNRLCLNLVDVEDVAYINASLIEAALTFIDQQLGEGRKVLVHCNQGQSRAPSIALLYMGHNDSLYGSKSAEEAIEHFRDIYPQYAPAGGMAGYLRANWPIQQAA